MIRPDPDAGGRSGPDYRPTPSCLLRALTQFVLPFGAADGKRFVVWEPATGAGAIADALAGAGWAVVATDIEPRRNDIVRLDFLRDAPLAAPQPTILCTNPPFGGVNRVHHPDFAVVRPGLSIERGPPLAH